MPSFEAVATQIIIERFSPHLHTLKPLLTSAFSASKIEIDVSGVPFMGIEVGFIGEKVGVLGGNTLIASYPNQSFAGAVDLNRIVGNTILMDPRKAPEIRELTDAAQKEIAEAIQELEAGTCKTFDNIDELFEDLESE